MYWQIVLIFLGVPLAASLLYLASWVIYTFRYDQKIRTITDLELGKEVRSCRIGGWRFESVCFELVRRTRRETDWGMALMPEKIMMTTALRALPVDILEAITESKDVEPYLQLEAASVLVFIHNAPPNSRIFVTLRRFYGSDAEN